MLETPKASNTKIGENFGDNTMGNQQAQVIYNKASETTKGQLS